MPGDSALCLATCLLPAIEAGHANGSQSRVKHLATAHALVTGFASRIAGDNAAAAAVLGQIFDRAGWNGSHGAVGLALALAIGLTAKLTDAHDFKT